ncbi:MAG: hypothetical protein ACTHK6_10335 [Solirubrobacterales bacterium]
MGKVIRGGVLVAALVASAVGAASAFGSTAQITEATVNPTWTQGSFAGAVEWTGCAHSGPRVVECASTPYAAIASGNSAQACDSTDRVPVWEGEKRSYAGAQSFAVSDFPLDGSNGKVLCLGLIETSVAEIPCVPPGEPIPPGWHCPYKTSNEDAPLATRVLEADRASEPSGEPEPGRPGPPNPEPQACGQHRHRRNGRCVRNRHHRRFFVFQHQKVP